MRDIFVGAVLVATAAGFSSSADAVVLNVGETARVNYSPGASGPGTTPFAFIALGFNFSTNDPFGPNEDLSYNVYAPDNTLIGSGSQAAGNSVYTSGLFGALTLSVFPSPQLDSTSFYATVTNIGPTGTFDLLGGQADLYNFGGGNSQFASVGTVVPELSTWTMMTIGMGGLGFGVHRARRLRASDGNPSTL